MQPVTTRREPSLRTSPRARVVSIDSWRAASMNAHVLTTTRSAPEASAAGTRPSASRLATTLSESTAFFGHPNVSTQNDCAVTAGQATGGVPTTLLPRVARPEGSPSLRAVGNLDAADEREVVRA